MVVPLRIGGGSRLKIFEALAAECPVVSTRVGAEGLHLESGRHFVEVETIDNMAAASLRTFAIPARSPKWPTADVGDRGTLSLGVALREARSDLDRASTHKSGRA